MLDFQGASPRSATLQEVLETSFLARPASLFYADKTLMLALLKAAVESANSHLKKKCFVAPLTYL